MAVCEVIDINEYRARRNAPRSTATGGASRWEILTGRVRECFCAFLTRVGLPAPIRDAEITDSLSGQSIKIRVGRLFTRISINGRDYYFDRLNGLVDGTGCGCR